MSNTIATLKKLYKDLTGSEPKKVIPLPASGSDRQYFRLVNHSLVDDNHVIGAYNESVKENAAFIEFTNHFSSINLPVPEIYLVSYDKRAYLQQDLGDQTLFALLSEEGLSEKVKGFYRQIVRLLPQIQINGIRGLDLSFCYPRREFDKQSMMWDLNYFKYYFAKLSGFQFDEQALEDDFKTLTEFLTKADNHFFMFRDYQSRNIMIKNEKPYIIDYQGGRLGPLQYDLASLLFDAKANLPQWFRDELIEEYLTSLELVIPDNTSFKENFLRYFDGFVLMRILQALGAYGFRGYFQKKKHFLQSIPFAMHNLEALLSRQTFNLQIPELRKILHQGFEKTKEEQELKAPDLSVRVLSFSYKVGLPVDNSGNGGGFVFDCRALPNPGRLEEYKSQSGLDEPVINYLESHSEIEEFLNHVFRLVDISVKNYIERGFTSLMVSFGCTGGRHRSVYCAERLAVHLNKNYGLQSKAEHTEKPRW